MSRFMTKNAGSPFVNIQSEAIDWILNLPSLRHDMLRLYRINVNKYADEEGAAETSNIGNEVYSDYLELIKHTFNAQLNGGSEEGNIMMLISGIYLKVHIGSTR